MDSCFWHLNRASINFVVREKHTASLDSKFLINNNSGTFSSLKKKKRKRGFFVGLFVLMIFPVPNKTNYTKMQTQNKSNEWQEKYRMGI